jgi:hypothetical protein
MPEGRRAVFSGLHEAESRLAVRQRQFVWVTRSCGSLGFADPTARIGYAYLTSQMGTRPTGDPRDVALRRALYFAIPASSGAVGNDYYSRQAMSDLCLR